MTPFHKFHGTGNDFIMLDGRLLDEMPSPKAIAALCHRRFGIGADGLIVVKPCEGFDFEMVYFNSDGSLASMCGNGARCAVAYGFMKGMVSESAVFLAGDGQHTAIVKAVNASEWDVEISMRDTTLPVNTGNKIEINTGTPHVVNIVDTVDEIDVVAMGRSIRYSPRFEKEGINVDWVNIGKGKLKVRTYERGVEDETLSCGTGVTACALVASMLKGTDHWEVETRGGNLRVSLDTGDKVFTNIRLAGPAAMVFSGEVNIPDRG